MRVSSSSWGYPKNAGWLISWKILVEWMMTGGTPMTKRKPSDGFPRYPDNVPFLDRHLHRKRQNIIPLPWDSTAFQRGFKGVSQPIGNPFVDVPIGVIGWLAYPILGRWLNKTMVKKTTMATISGMILQVGPSRCLVLGWLGWKCLWNGEIPSNILSWRKLGWVKPPGLPVPWYPVPRF